MWWTPAILQSVFLQNWFSDRSIMCRTIKDRVQYMSPRAPPRAGARNPGWAPASGAPGRRSSRTTTTPPPLWPVCLDHKHNQTRTFLKFSTKHNRRAVNLQLTAHSSHSQPTFTAHVHSHAHSHTHSPHARVALVICRASSRRSVMSEAAAAEALAESGGATCAVSPSPTAVAAVRRPWSAISSPACVQVKTVRV